MSVSNVAVIGAGTSGLCAAKHCLQQGFQVTVYEQNDTIGGIWYYTDDVGKDKFGVAIHTPMYQELRSNLPFQVMEFPDHKYPENAISYPPHRDVLAFIHSYADRFDLKRHIKLSHLTISVKPIENDKWEIIVKDLVNGTFETKIYDAIMVCNGHYFKPRVPQLDGVDSFQGEILHSHNFRTAKAYCGKTVLVIGGGPSGIDLVLHLSKTASRITFSQHKINGESKESFAQRQQLLPDNVTLQENVRRFYPNGAEFIDGSCQSFEVIFFATGYKFSYPFLSTDCGIYVDDNFVQPLYKQIFNIEYATMAFIGIPYSACNTQMFDLQVRFALKFLSAEKKLPSKSEMIGDMRMQTQIHWNKGYRKHRTHCLAMEQADYYRQLSETANIKNLPAVLPAIFLDHFVTVGKEPSDFRKYRYTVLDEKTFSKSKVE
ncbi:senecionine N-oxygenase-like isoform X1 [Bradysia coprophila]|uniref:senecionine N-oxygenase-like isoform X1 n=1 Tax=Bradysia coprophila TaxID=38358 RepID=UPI00187DBC19|nr:senecionine N-oxygenase-like isoform X1 [Bradysia coprophila]